MKRSLQLPVIAFGIAAFVMGCGQTSVPSATSEDFISQLQRQIAEPEFEPAQAVANLVRQRAAEASFGVPGAC